MAVNPSNPFNSPKIFQTPNGKSPVEPVNLCECGNMFPLDTHPRTGKKCCSACYMDGRKSLMQDLGIDDILFRQTRKVHASTKER